MLSKWTGIVNSVLNELVFFFFKRIDCKWDFGSWYCCVIKIIRIVLIMRSCC